MSEEKAPAGCVLVVEDDPDVRRIVVRSLRFGGVEAAEADTGRRALELARATPFDVILTDLGLPDLSGVKLVRMLRAAAPRARLIVLSGSSGELSAEECASLRVDLTLAKPLEVQALIAAVSEVLARRSER
jgi:CheY-like chemotaxis protein